MNNFGKFGIKHEIAKRWTPLDWYFSQRVSKMIDPFNADTLMTKLIIENKPSLIGRLGGTEARFLGEYYKISKHKLIQDFLFKSKPNWIKRSKEINSNAGFYFQTMRDVQSFYDLYDKALEDTDLLGAWGTAFAWIESNYVDSIGKFIPVPMTAPWIESYNPNQETKPWSDSLDGRTVLVVSPFAQSISEQHKRIEMVFPKHSYPNFKLLTIKAPQTTGFVSNSKPTWFENLQYIKNQIAEKSFDVALISAGAYSFPLAHFVKNIGKIGVHTGGGLQLYFGVLGRRWDHLDSINQIKNSYWVRPNKSETPLNALTIEGGCYW
jgi:hypothetical protein